MMRRPPSSLFFPYTPLFFFFFNDTATTEIYTLSLHDALPISAARRWPGAGAGVSVHSAAGARNRQIRRARRSLRPAQSAWMLVWLFSFLLHLRVRVRVPPPAGAVIGQDYTARARRSSVAHWRTR